MMYPSIINSARPVQDISSDLEQYFGASALEVTVTQDFCCEALVIIMVVVVLVVRFSEVT